MRLDHPIFQGPRRPKLALTRLKTPAGYAKWPDGKNLPAELDAWVVQTGKLGTELDYGLVSTPYGFDDSPDAEVISSGNNSKAVSSVAIGRHANFMLWGFAGDPGQLTESARDVFVNAVVYMNRFDDTPMLVERVASHRTFAPFYAGFVAAAKTGNAEWAQKMFAASLLSAAGGDGTKLLALLEQDREYLMSGKAGTGFEVDPDCKALGIGNRDRQLLTAIADRLAKNEADEVGRRLLARYLPEQSQMSSAVFAAFVARNSPRLFFSDVGGYRWFVDRTRPAAVNSR